MTMQLFLAWVNEQRHEAERRRKAYSAANEPVDCAVQLGREEAFEDVIAKIRRELAAGAK